MIKQPLAWPLGINPDADKDAQERGLKHWSCVSPWGNRLWVRRDGFSYVAQFNTVGGYPEELRQVDNHYPISNDFAEFVSYYENADEWYLALIDVANLFSAAHLVDNKEDWITEWETKTPERVFFDKYPEYINTF